MFDSSVFQKLFAKTDMRGLYAVRGELLEFCNEAQTADIIRCASEVLNKAGPVMMTPHFRFKSDTSEEGQSKPRVILEVFYCEPVGERQIGALYLKVNQGEQRWQTALELDGRA